MIRPLTFLTLFAACGSGMYLYTEKHRAELLDRKITHVMRETEAARQRTGMLRAEWEVLNNPDRLRPMAEQYDSGLRSMEPGQWVQLADLGARLPPPAAPAPAPSGGTDDGAAFDGPAVADNTPVVAAPADPGINDMPPPKPEAVAAAAPKPASAHPTAKQLAHAQPHKPAHPVALADQDDPMDGNPLARSSPLPLASPQPAHARVLSAMARPMRAGRHVQQAVVTAAPVALGPAPYVGSALGGRGAVPAPIPLRDQ
jgi:hypothetical protein